MGEENNHIKIYSAEEIQSYLEGRMTPADMHALERAALEDPFLADAIDGYHQSGIKAGKAELELKQSLQDRVTDSKRNRTIPAWLKIAAAVAVLVTTVVSITLVINPGAKNDAIVSSQKKAQNKLEDTATIMESGVRSQQSENKPEVRKETQTPSSPPQQKLNSVSNNKETRLLELQQEAKAEDANTDLPPTSAAPEKSYSSQLKGKVSGVVIDSNMRPVSGATVTMARQQVVTDDSGLFALKSTDTVMNVEIQSVGFATRNAIVKDDAVLDTIVLRPSTPALEEVVVTGYGTKKKVRASNRQTNSTSAIASPSIPWEEYNQYLRKNLQSSGLDTIPGEAVVSFTASSDGRLSKFKLEKPAPSKALNVLLIDIIKTGPKWDVHGGKSARGTVQIQLGTGN
jgi:outer membrane biosynthesis protein TonB